MAERWLRDSLSTVTLAPSSLLRVFFIDAFPAHRLPISGLRGKGLPFAISLSTQSVWLVAWIWWWAD